MADSPTNPAAPVLPSALPSEPLVRLRRASRRRLWPFIAGLAVLAIVAALGWWAVAGNKFWTDGAGLHLADNEARVREVVWTPPIPLTIFNTTDQEYEPSISPDGDELYFVRGKAGQNPGGAGHNADIYVSYRRSGAWAPPVPVNAVNSDYDDLGPRVTADGKFLLFYSNRPGGFGGYDIWAAPRLPADGPVPGGWGKPFNLGPGVNTEFDEYNPDPSPDGRRLFFATNRKTASGEQKQAWRATIRTGMNADFDLWYAVREASAETAGAAGLTDDSGTGEKPQAPEKIANLVFKNAIEVPGVNTPFAEGASCISPAGDFLYFASDRPGGYGKFDIYRSRVGTDGTFGPVENLGPAINTSDNETDPQLALNGFRLYFSSDRQTGTPGSRSTPGQTGESASGNSGSARPAEGGGYDLLQSDSREVYSVRAGHRLPHVGWSWLVLALSLLALVPLVMFMRKWDDKRLSLLQKCLLVSLLVHVLITLGLSMKEVVPQAYHYVRQAQGIEPPVDLTLTLNGPASRADDIGAAIRQQSSSDIPTPAAPPVAAAQPIPGAEALDVPALPAGIQLPVARANAGGGEVTIQVDAPKIEMPKPALAGPLPPALPSVTPQAFDLDLKIAAAPHVSQAEAMPRVAPDPSAPFARVEPAAVKIDHKLEVRNPRQVSPPVAVPAESIIKPADAARPALPTVNFAGVGAMPPAEAAIPVETLRLPAAPVSSPGPETPAVVETGSAMARQVSQVPVETHVSLAPAGTVLPKVDLTARSQASDVPHAIPAPADVTAGTADLPKLAKPDAGSLPDVGNLTAPAPVNKVAAADANPIGKSDVETALNPSRQVPSTVAGAADPAAAALAPVKAPKVDDPHGSIVGTPAPHVAPDPGATASEVPAPGPQAPATADVPVELASRPPGPTAGLLANQPDLPDPGAAGGPVRAPRLPASASTVTGPIPSPRLPRESGPTASLVAEASRTGPATIGLTVPPKVQPTVPPTDIDTGPTPGLRPTMDGEKAVASGRPDSPETPDIPGALDRRGPMAAATQPAPLDASNTGIAGASLPRVAIPAESLATAPDVRAAAGIPLPPHASVDPTTPVDVTAGPDVAPQTIADGQKAAAAGQPEAPAPSEVPTAITRGPLAASTTQPAGIPLPNASPVLGTVSGGSPATSSISRDVAPTTRPVDTTTAFALAQPPAAGRGGDVTAAPDIAPQIAPPRAGVSPVEALPGVPDTARAGELAAAPRRFDAGTVDLRPGAATVDPAPPRVALPAVNGKQGAGESMASAAVVATGRVVPSPAGRPVGPAGPVDVAGEAIAIEPLKTGRPRVEAPAALGGNLTNPPNGTEGGAMSARQPMPAVDNSRPGSTMLASARIPGIASSPRLPRSAGVDPANQALDSAAGRMRPRTISGPAGAAPEIGGAEPTLAAPGSLFQRSPEQRKPLVEKRGGTPESEGAVERALAYLSRQQEPDGRWTVFNDDGSQPGKRGHHPHDMACTGLASLAFLTADHTPAKEGPYRDSVAKAIDFLLSQEGADGDLRGPPQLRGGGADQGNMYDQGICTMALCEAAVMTGDRRYTEAALRAARFIVNAQNAEGGWRYTPGEAGDTSVLGWQMLALHDAEQLGFSVPDPTRARAEKYLKAASQGETKILVGYMPGHSTSSAMTAEALFSRLLLGDDITGPQTREVCAYLTRQLPQPGGADFYFWYYASLSLSQMPDLVKAAPRAGDGDANLAADTWKKWNATTRDTLINMQKKGGPADGSWSNSEWAERGGRVFTTSLATLTLEVYYRYLPLRAADDDTDTTPNKDRPNSDPRRAAAEIKAGKSVVESKRTPATPRGKGWNDPGGHYPGIEPN